MALDSIGFAVAVGPPNFRSTWGHGSSDPDLAVGQVAQTQDVTAAHAVSSSFVLLLPGLISGHPVPEG